MRRKVEEYLSTRYTSTRVHWFHKVVPPNKRPEPMAVLRTAIGSSLNVRPKEKESC